MQRRDFVKLIGIAPGALTAPWNLAEAHERLIGNLLYPDQQVPADQWVLHHTTCAECPTGG